jgi:hypothetical protein
MKADAWEVFDPRDGRPQFVTDCEETAKSIAADYGLDHAPKGMESSGNSWVAWKQT